MTSSRSDAQAADALERILALLDEARVRKEIDEPIDAAIAGFRFEETSPVSHRHFHQIISDFVHRVYRQGIAPHQALSSTQASAEAIALLEEGYWGAQARGYDAALLDAANPAHNGIELVLAQLAEIIKDNQRRQYTHWVLATSLGPLAWGERCRVAALLLDRLRPYLTPPLQRCVAAQVVDELPVLITTHLSTDAVLQSMSDITTSRRDI
jgi:hypothetical protein